MRLHTHLLDSCIIYLKMGNISLDKVNQCPHEHICIFLSAVDCGCHVTSCFEFGPNFLTMMDWNPEVLQWFFIILTEMKQNNSAPFSKSSDSYSIPLFISIESSKCSMVPVKEQAPIIHTSSEWFNTLKKKTNGIISGLGFFLFFFTLCD